MNDLCECTYVLSQWGIVLVIKLFKNLFYQKIPITKSVLLNWYFSMKKKEKDSGDF